MAWSLGYLPIPAPERLDVFFLAAGKALYLASGYEAKCKSVLQVARLVDALSAGNDLDAAAAICRAMKEKLLHATLAELRERDATADASEYEVMDRARKARNYIAHEAAWLGHLSYVGTVALASKTRALREAVADLARGDNLVSQWIYEIEEKEAAPFAIVNDYSARIDAWLFGGGTRP